MADGGNRRTVAIIILLYILIAFGIILFIITKYREKNSRCNVLNSIATEDNKDKIKKITGGSVNKSNSEAPDMIQDGINETDIFLHSLVNYHVKSAYNCCAVKSFRNSFVSSCALRNCLKLGVRCLDFEIYSIGNKAVVGASSKDLNINTKETFNDIDFADVLKIINDEGFDNNNTLQYFENDDAKDSILDFPIILHLRIKTKNRRAYDNMAESLFSILGDRLMDSKYTIQKQIKTWGNNNWETDDTASPEKIGMENNLIFAPMIKNNQRPPDEGSDDTNSYELNDDFRGKVIVIFNIKTIIPSASTNNYGWEDFLNLTKESSGDTQYGNIVNYINLISPSPDCNTIRNFDVENATDLQKVEIKDEAKYRLMISIPTIASASTNHNYANHLNLGIQMPCLSFQNLRNSSSVIKCAEASDAAKEKEDCNTYILKYLKHFNNNGGAYFKQKDKAFILAMGASVSATLVADYSQTSAIYNDVQI